MPMPMPFTLRQLEYFIAVAEHGSITAAASAINVSQPSISVAVADLEAIVGHRLFQRRAGHRLTISASGRRLLMQARATIATAAEIAGHDESWIESTALSISSFRDIGPMYLPRLLMDFRQVSPTVDYRLEEGDLVDVRAKILDGRCEVALTYDIDLKSNNIASDPIDALAPYVMMPETHNLASLDRVGLEAICFERVVIEDFPVTLDYFLDIFRKHRLAVPDVQKVSSFEMQRGLVANGWGVGLSCVRPRTDKSYDGSTLVCRPLESREEPQKIVLAHLGERTLSGVARRFRQAALKAIWPGP